MVQYWVKFCNVYNQILFWLDQARSQEFALGEGGCFGDWKKLQKILTHIFNELWSDWVGFSDQNKVISIKKKSLHQILTVFFHPKSSDLQKKGLHQNLTRFSVQNQMISKKKKNLYQNPVAFLEQL